MTERAERSGRCWLDLKWCKVTDIVDNKMEGREKLVDCCIEAAVPVKAVMIATLAPEGEGSGEN